LTKKGSFARCVDDVRRKGGADDPAAVCAAAKRKTGEDLHNPVMFSRSGMPVIISIQPSTRRKGYWDLFVGGTHRVTKKTKKGAEGYARRILQANPGRSNPADLAAEAFRATHGYEPEHEIVTVEEEHYHEFLPAWGELIDMVIVPPGERKGVRLTRFKGAMLAFSEQYESSPQLHLVGGDQSCDPTVFGIRTNHELETLGKVVDITYYTVKTHLGRDGGDANYVHAFAEETAKRKARHVRILNSPDVIYDRLNEKLKFSGGVYEITPEGIRD
jgi:hypothetical protein